MLFTRLLTPALLLALTFNVAAFAAGSDETCTVLKQRDYKLGAFTVYLGEKRARVDCMNGKCTIVAAAPTWDVVLFNKDKQYFLVDRKSWREAGLKNMTRSIRELFDPRHHTLTKVKCLGRDSIKTSRIVRNYKRDSLDIAFRSKPNQKKINGGRTVTYTASSDFKFNKAIADFVEGFYLTLPSARVLLSTVTEIDGDKSASFVTYSIEKKSYPESFFAIPGGLKKVYSISAVATGQDVEGVLLEVLGDDHP
jgi:hypothetical protein